MVFVGAISKLTPVLNFSDAVFGLLAIPNLICNVALSGKLKKALKEYEATI
jgi:AGCS family alanine or glycine:cation symporter